jgi:oligopeptide transport system substrate-binding protein
MRLKQAGLFVLILSLTAGALSCANSTAAGEPFFGVTEPPPGQFMRYANGSEPRSLDPQMSDGQPEARIYMALYEGFTEYEPKTAKPIPALAERWEINKDYTEFTFYLRKNARWSDGAPINANDFVYSLRRGLNPATAALTTGLATHVKYAMAYNSEAAFVRDPATGRFLLDKDFKGGLDLAGPQDKDEDKEASGPATKPDKGDKKTTDENAKPAASEFSDFMRGEKRLTVPTKDAERAALLKDNLKLQREIKDKELVPVKAEDVGIEALDNYTVRIYLQQPVPFFLSTTPHQFFRLVPRHVVEKHGDKWTLPENIVTCGPFKVKEWLPYNRLSLEKDPNYWDAANVKLNRLDFYPIEETSTTMNLYKTGGVDAFINHGVPAAWVESVQNYKDYLKYPEAGNVFVKINTTRPPFDNADVRKAFNLAVDKVAYAASRKTVLPLFAFVPEGIFAGYPSPKGAQFNPQEAKKLLASAGYRDAIGNFDPSKFPVQDVEYLYSTGEANRALAEFLQAQWKQNLGVTVPLRVMEFKVFLETTSQFDYKGLAQGIWGADYMDPNTFLDLFYSKTAGSDTGWSDPVFARMMDEANHQLDAAKRYEMLSNAETYLLNAQPIIPMSAPSTNFMKKPYVKGFYPNPQSLYAWKSVYIEYDKTKWDLTPPKMSE